MTKESKRRKKKGRKGRKGKGHIIIYTCARERGKGGLKGGPHAGGRRNTERRRDTEKIRGKARGKKGKVRREKGHRHNMRPFYFTKNGEKKTG
ncbi:hypothetical protein [Bacteroides heparinolyticus]|uniref:hypothetical protein n=1 Tax=Prevotella heparinolytica TaxID=28113 RepID=UPI0035A1967E